MANHEVVTLAICATAIFLVSPFVLVSAHRLITLLLGKPNMAIPAAFQPIIDSLNASATSISSSSTTISNTLANAPLPAGAIAPQDATDLQAGLQSASDAVSAAATGLANIANPPVPEPATT